MRYFVRVLNEAFRDRELSATQRNGIAYNYINPKGRQEQSFNLREKKKKNKKLKEKRKEKKKKKASWGPIFFSKCYL